MMVGVVMVMMVMQRDDLGAGYPRSFPQVHPGTRTYAHLISHDLQARRHVKRIVKHRCA
jgi:hypothetical protein